MWVRRNWSALFFCVLMGGERALAQTLPRGSGAVNIGGRELLSSNLYNENGELISPSSRLDVDFNATTMRSGKAGADLKKLYENIQKYDTNSGAGQSSIGDELTLGTQKGVVKPTVHATFAGMAFGVTDKITLFWGAPFIDAAVDADIVFEGKNNASEIKAKLGDAAFDELKAGLDEASKVNRDSIFNEITEKKQYKSIKRWQYKGVGDTTLGLRTGWAFQIRRGRKYDLGLTVQLNLPTGPAFDPDSLTQLPISTGYKSVSVLTDHRITWTYVASGAELGGAYGLPFDRLQRVPVAGERLIPIERKTKVHVQPGISGKASLYGLVGNATYRGQYKIGIKQQQAHQFSGSLAGDYKSMGRPTASNELYHEASLILTTVKIYRQRKFLVPFILTLTGHDSISGVNGIAERYLELSFLTFFSTPMMKK
jgi:hypothetical protein